MKACIDDRLISAIGKLIHICILGFSWVFLYNTLSVTNFYIFVLYYMQNGSTS